MLRGTRGFPACPHQAEKGSLKPGLAQMHLHQCSDTLCWRDMKMPEQRSHALPRHHLHICSVLPPCSQDPTFWSCKGLWLEPGGPWAV